MSFLPASVQVNKRIFIDNGIPRYKKVERSLFTRMFTRPWRPFQSYILQVVYIIKKYGHDIFIMNDHTYEWLKQHYRSIKAKQIWDATNGENPSSPSKSNN